MKTGKGEVREMLERGVRRTKIHRCGGRKQHGTLKTRPQVDRAASSQESPFLMILRTFLAPLILIQQLTHYDSHSLEAVSHPSSSQVIDQATFPFISYLFPMMSHCVSFYYSFSL